MLWRKTWTTRSSQTRLLNIPYCLGLICWLYRGYIGVIYSIILQYCYCQCHCTGSAIESCPPLLLLLLVLLPHAGDAATTIPLLLDAFLAMSDDSSAGCLQEDDTEDSGPALAGGYYRGGDAKGNRKVTVHKNEPRRAQ